MCEFQVLDLGKTIGNTRICAGLYLLRIDVPEKKAKKISYVAST